MFKKFLLGVAACVLMISTLTGCGGSETSNAPKTPAKATIGVIYHLNASEELYTEIMQKLEKSYRPSKAHLVDNYKYFNNIKEMVLALDAGQIDIISTYQCVADYMISRNDKLEILTSERVLRDSFCLAVREGDTILRNELNKAIKSMTDDGTLVKLSKQYIVDLKPGEDPPPVEIEEIPGAETIKVAVTGDLPPLDLILADGTPAGFSTAVLAEISKRLGKNMELVNIESSARASVLTSKTADVVFWVSVPEDNNLIPEYIDRPEGVSLTQPYYSDKIVHMDLKPSK